MPTTKRKPFFWGGGGYAFYSKNLMTMFEGKSSKIKNSIYMGNKN